MNYIIGKGQFEAEFLKQMPANQWLPGRPTTLLDVLSFHKSGFEKCLLCLILNLRLLLHVWSSGIQKLPCFVIDQVSDWHLAQP